MKYLTQFTACLLFALALPLASPAAAKPPTGTSVTMSYRHIELAGSINYKVIKDAQKKLMAFAAQGDDPIWLLINSSGGSVMDGLILVDTMKASKAPIHCIVESIAYSMAAIILSYCDGRYGLEHATYMLHEASYGTTGEDPHNRSKMAFLTDFLDKLHVEIAHNLKMDPKVYRERIRDTWWLTSKEAYEAGLIEAIVTSIQYEDIPIEKTTETRTITRTQEHELRPTPSIPKRRD